MNYGVTFFTISVLSNKFSPLIPSALGRLPYTDYRNYRPRLRLIYLWWSPDDRASVRPIYSRPYLLNIDQCKYPKQVCKYKALLCWIVGVEAQSYTFISFGRVRMMHWLLIIVIDGVKRNESDCQLIPQWMWRGWSAQWRKTLRMYSSTNTDQQNM